MSIEAETIVENQAMVLDAKDRRARIERRGRERRKPGSRVNREAPRRSQMKLIGGYAASLMTGIFVLTLVAGEVLMDGPPLMGAVITGAVAALSIFILMMGCIEQRLIEIRLELLIANGGTREADRRSHDPQGSDRRRGGRAGDAAP